MTTLEVEARERNANRWQPEQEPAIWCKCVDCGQGIRIEGAPKTCPACGEPLWVVGVEP